MNNSGGHATKLERIARTLCERAEFMAQEAKARGFRFFVCRLDMGPDATPLLLQFADGNGAYFERSLGIKQIAAENGIRLNLSDAVYVKIKVQSHISSMPGIEALGRGMRVNRLPARVPTKKRK